MSEYVCCRHCRHNQPDIRAHYIACHHVGCKGSAAPSWSMRWMARLNLLPLQRKVRA